MAIIEIHGGPITHRYLMKKSKDELATLYMRLLRETDADAKDAERYSRLRHKLTCGRFTAAEELAVLAAKSAAEMDAAVDAMNGANA